MTSAADKIEQRQSQPRFTRDVRLVLDSEAFAEAQQVEHQLEQAVLSPGDGDVTEPGPAQLADRLDAIYATCPPSLFRFVAFTPSEWSDLAGEHGDDNRAMWADAFARSCVVFDGEPFYEDDLTAADDLDSDELNLESVADFRETLTAGQWSTFVACIKGLNESLFDLRPTSAAYAQARRMRRNSTSATGS